MFFYCNDFVWMTVWNMKMYGFILVSHDWFDNLWSWFLWKVKGFSRIFAWKLALSKLLKQHKQENHIFYVSWNSLPAKDNCQDQSPDFLQSSLPLCGNICSGRRKSNLIEKIISERATITGWKLRLVVFLVLQLHSWAFRRDEQSLPSVGRNADFC